MLPPHIVLIDKPTGITSFEVIRRLRRIHSIRKMGHAGTLDPLASGLLIVGMGEATKLLSHYLALPKTYEATIRIGLATTTGDIEGDITAETRPVRLDEANLRRVLKSMEGTLTLPVPAYSAIKQGGVRLYKKAREARRQGRVFVDVPEKEMCVYTALFRTMHHTPEGYGEVLVHFAVGSGTYIRALAVECGKRLGLPATLATLRRTQIGEYRVEDATPL